LKTPSSGIAGPWARLTAVSALALILAASLPPTLEIREPDLVADYFAADPASVTAGAIIVLGGVIIVWRGAMIPRNAPTCFATGGVSGTSSLVASIGGPPLALLYGSGDGPTMRSSVSSVLAVGLLVTIGVRAATGNISGAELGVSLILLPAVGLGLATSTRIVPRVDRVILRAAILFQQYRNAEQEYWLSLRPLAPMSVLFFQ